MKCIPNFDSFPFDVRQYDPYWCTLANAEAVTRYHVPNSKISQNALWDAFKLSCEVRLRDPIRELGLLSFTEQPLSTHEDLSWAQIKHFPASDFKSFDDFAATLEQGVDEGEPHIISVPVLHFPDGALTKDRHMLTVIGYDEKQFRIFDSTNSLYARYYDSLKSKFHDAFGLARQDVTDTLLLRPRIRA